MTTTQQLFRAADFARIKRNLQLEGKVTPNPKKELRRAKISFNENPDFSKPLTEVLILKK